MVDLIELGMVDFDIIMGMDWLYSCFSKIDCPTRTVGFEFPTDSVIEWKGDNVVPKGFPHKGYNAIWSETKIEFEVVGDPSIIMLVETIEVNEELTYEEIPISILDRKVRKIRNKEIISVKVLWRNQQVEEVTAKEEMKKKYSHLFE
ncbi:uncharacterized protein [Nicotiana tomentosiformis]|uniref:uncharacterized protein n=1 Tax=Nicotiana tomentosiformis TaxID=4098 RepID=UPI00388C8225